MNKLKNFVLNLILVDLILIVLIGGYLGINAILGDDITLTPFNYGSATYNNNVFTNLPANVVDASQSQSQDAPLVTVTSQNNGNGNSQNNPHYGYDNDDDDASDEDYTYIPSNPQFIPRKTAQRVLEQLSHTGKARVIVDLSDPSRAEQVLGILNNFDKKVDMANGFAGYLDIGDLQRLEASGLVDYVYEDRKLTIANAESFPLIQADKAASASYNQFADLTGKGQTVCIIDTGVEYNHNDLGDCTGSEFLNGNCPKTIGGWNYVDNNDDPIDYNGHGTAIAGIIAGNGTGYQGIAPEAKIIAMRVVDSDNTAYESDVGAAVQWCTDNATKFNITMMSIAMVFDHPIFDYNETSWCDGDPIFTYIDEAVSNNITVFAPTGNSEDTTEIAFPACGTNTIAVSAVSDGSGGGSAVDVIPSKPIDSWGPDRYPGMTDLMAPGQRIYTLWKGETYSADMGGTSFASAHAVGSAMLLREYYEEKYSTILTPTEIRNILTTTGKPIYDSNTSAYYPRIDILAAIRYETNAPTVTQENPANAATENEGTITFEYNTVDNEHNIKNCSLYIDGSLDQTDTTITESVTQSFTKSLTPATYNWEIKCYDNSTVPNEGVSGTRSLTVQAAPSDTTPPVVNLESSYAINVEPSADVTLEYNVIDEESGIKNCSLYLNGAIDQTDTTITESTTQSFTISSISAGTYNWYVSCYDNSTIPNEGVSETRTIYAETHTYGSHAGFELINLDDVLSYDKKILQTVWPSLTYDYLEGKGTNELTGKGQTVAIIDSGLSWSHQEFNGKVLAEWDFYENDDSAQDSWNHGTKMAGIIAAKGVNMEGIAPDANIVSLRITNSTGGGWTSNLYNALNWVSNNASIYNITTVYVGLGYSQYEGSESICIGSSISNKIDELTNMNITIVAPAGHDANITAIAAPACVANTISVGAVPDGGVYDADTWNLTAGGIQSNRRDGLLDLLAPGGDGATMTTNRTNYVGGTGIGTDMATSYVAGASMILREYWDARNWDYSPIGLVNGNIPNTLEYIFAKTGKMIEDDLNPGVYYPRLDIYAAINYEEYPPTVNLENPANAATENEGVITFEYNTADTQHDIKNCSLYIDGSLDQTDNSVTESVTQSFTKSLTPATYNWEVKCYDNSSVPNEGSSGTRTLTVQSTGKTPSTATLTFDKVSPQTYGTTITATCTDDNPEDVAKLYRDGVDITSENGVAVTLAAGTYNYICNVSETANYLADEDTGSFTINKAATTLTLTSVPSWNEVSGTETNVSCSADNSEVTEVLSRNGSTVSNPDVQTLAIGDYLYACTSLATQNYTAGSDVDTLRITIAPDTTDPVVTLVAPANAATETDSNVTFQWSVTDDQDPTLDCTLWNNKSGTWEPNPTNFQVDSGNTKTYSNTGWLNGEYIWNVICEDDAANGAFAAANRTFTVQSLDVTAPTVALGVPADGTTDNDGNVTIGYMPFDETATSLMCDVYSNTTGVWMKDTTQVTNNATTGNYVYYNLPNGDYRWNVECDDGTNQAFAAADYTFTVDAPTADVTPPFVTLTNPADASTDTDGDVTVQFTATDDKALAMPCDVYSDTSGSWQADGIDLVNSTHPAGSYDYTGLSDGTYTWNVKCYDGTNDAFAAANRTFTVSIPAPLNVDAQGPYSGSEGSSITFTALASGGLSPYEYRWDFNNDGSWDTSWSVSNSASNTWNDDYSGTVVVELRDSLSTIVNDSGSVVVNNVNPTANANGPYACNEGENISLSGSAIDPSAVDTFTYEWDLNNDGVYETAGQNPTFTCSAAGSFTVNLNVTDDDDGFDIDSTTVTVSAVAQPPQFNSALPDKTIDEGNLSPYILNLTGYVDDADNTTDELIFTIFSQSNSSLVDCTISAGHYVLCQNQGADLNGFSDVVIQVSDGQSSDTAGFRFTITPVNDAPVLDLISNIVVNEGESVQIVPNANDIDGDSLTYTYSSPLNASGEWLTTFADAGIYTVNVTVDDGNGGQDSQLVNVSVNDVQADVFVNYFNQQAPKPAVVGNVTFGFFVENTGSVPLSNVGWELDSGETNTVTGTIPSLTAGQKQIVFAKVDYTSAGAYLASITLDHNSLITETDETNNIKTLNVTIN